MSVLLYFSSTNGGTAITNDVSHGTGGNGTTLTAQTIYIRHSGTNSITNVKMYIAPYGGTYSGDKTAIDDHAEIIGWGNNVDYLLYGGFEINMNALDSFPYANWPHYYSKNPSYGVVCSTGLGDTQANAITLSSKSGAIADGTIQAGSSPNVRFKCRITIPATGVVVGKRQFTQYVICDYTS